MMDQPIPHFPATFNMAGYFLDERLEERAHHLAVIDDRGAYTYAQVHDLAGRVAAALWLAGVRPEDRCLIGLFDSVEFAASFFGTLKAGAVVAMVNPELPDADYEYYLHYTRCRALVADAALLSRTAHLLPACECLRVVIQVGDAPVGQAALMLPGV